jgi:hypothetical protein
LNLDRGVPLSNLFRNLCIVSFLLLAVISVTQTAPQNRIAKNIDNSQLTAIRGSAYPMARSALDRGRVDGSMRLENVSIVFKRSAAQQQDMDATRPAAGQRLSQLSQMADAATDG